MKGTSFQKPLEFNVQIEGESWRQGDLIQGSLRVRNHGGGELSEISVHLALGELKKVRQKNPDAFILLSTAKLDVSADSEAPSSWSFQFDRNAPVTDNTKSLFLLYGQGGDLSRLGQLQLPIKPFWLIDEFLETFKVGFKFVSKSHKTQKEGLEVKLSPPESKAFAAVEQLLLLFRFEGEQLNVSYTFNVNKLEASASSIDMKKEKRALKKTYPILQLQLPSGRFNHEAAEAAIREVLNGVESKVLL